MNGRHHKEKTNYFKYFPTTYPVTTGVIIGVTGSILICLIMEFFVL